MTTSKAHFVLYGRPYCHLCDDMLAALDGLRSEFSFSVEVVDVDGDPLLDAQYGELVPVLTAGQRKLCHYFFDAAVVREFLLDD